MADDGALVWRRANPWDVPVGCGCLYPFGVLVFSLALPLPPWVLGGVAAALAAAGGFTALFGVNSVEFTAHQVRLTGRARTRTRKLTDLAAVTVVHWGSQDTGYTETMLWLKWRTGGANSVLGAYAPRLADAIRRTTGLGENVAERWNPLRSSDGP